MTKTILLASTSPRRNEMLRWLEIPFKSAKPGVDEKLIRYSSPKELTRLLAEAKAEALRDVSPNTIIIGSDAVVSFQGKILEQPADKKQQREMIELQKGKEAEVYSAVCVIDTSTGEKITKVKVTPYKMASPSDEQIDDYVASGEGLDKAGGYGQQDRDGLFVDSINGCYTNAIGFPLCDVADLLQQMGVTISVDVKEKVSSNTGREC